MSERGGVVERVEGFALDAARKASRGSGLDVERLYRAHVDVEAGYVARPDRLTATYWRKVAERYDYLTALALDRTP